MPNRLPIPPELQHLIEKREREDPRTAERRSGEDRRESDLGPIGRIQSVEDLEELTLAEDRSGTERRKGRARRKRKRRQADADPPASDTAE